MATYKLIATVYPDAASNTSLSSAFAVPGEYTHFMIEMPNLRAITATCGMQVQGCDSLDGTYYTVGYSNNPATATSGFRAWDAGTTTPGSMVICEALQFVPGYAKIKFTATLTANAYCARVFGRKFD